MEVGRRRVAARNGVVAGSVWESRMKSDEVKGGIKVFNGGEESSEENGDKRLRPKQSPAVGVSGKRKTWKSDNSEGGFERNSIQIARQRSEQSRNLDEQCKELSMSADGVKRSPVQSKKTRSEVGKELSVSVDGIERSPIQRMKTRSEEAKELSVSVDRIERNLTQIGKVKCESQKLVGQSPGESGDGVERNSIQLRKVKSDSNKGLDESVDVNDRNPIPLTTAKSGSNKFLDGPVKNLDGLGDGTESSSIELKMEKLDLNRTVDDSTEDPDEFVEAIEKNPVGVDKSRSDETCKEFGVCEEKVISSSLSNLGQVNSAPQMVAADDDDDGSGGDEEAWDEELDEEIECEIEKKSFDVKEINMPEQKPKQAVNEGKNLHQVQEKPLPISSIVKKHAPPLVNYSRTNPIPTKTKAIPVLNRFQKTSETHTGFQSIPQTHNKLQSLVDLVMWRDVSKSAFVFGMGTFIVISSSYTEGLNISLISVFSYLGLVYLAAIFLFRTFVCRGVVDNTTHVLGEEEAVWLLKMILPYLNEFLLKIRALFSGDPATTMKLAVLLFVLARCGSSITIWKMAKLGFFGVFTVPKICSSYSTQLTAFGKFWAGRFQDAWDSCSHKKAVAFGIFTIVWNLSSVVARIWAVFMLFVAFRYYQQSVMWRDDCVENEAKCETSWQAQMGGRRRRCGPTTFEIRKEKKKF